VTRPKEKSIRNYHKGKWCWMIIDGNLEEKYTKKKNAIYKYKKHYKNYLL